MDTYPSLDDFPPLRNDAPLLPQLIHFAPPDLPWLCRKIRQTGAEGDLEKEDIDHPHAEGKQRKGGAKGRRTRRAPTVTVHQEASATPDMRYPDTTCQPAPPPERRIDGSDRIAPKCCHRADRTNGTVYCRLKVVQNLLPPGLERKSAVIRWPEESETPRGQKWRTVCQLVALHLYHADLQLGIRVTNTSANSTGFAVSYKSIMFCVY